MSGISHSLHSQYFTVKNLLTVNDGLIMREREKKQEKKMNFFEEVRQCATQFLCLCLLYDVFVCIVSRSKY